MSENVAQSVGWLLPSESGLELDRFLASVRFDEQGLAPAIVQDANSGLVLMMAWVNAESLRRTLRVGETVFWSRSRNEFWHKGATSGNRQRVVEVRLDCDGDTLLILVHPAGPACHSGAQSCFFTAYQHNDG
jgi:phosphoribosyl-AMP cyclohydrolase